MCVYVRRETEQKVGHVKKGLAARCAESEQHIQTQVSLLCIVAAYKQTAEALEVTC